MISRGRVTKYVSQGGGGVAKRWPAMLAPSATATAVATLRTSATCTGALSFTWKG